MSGEEVALAAEAAPIVLAAISAYGRAVLSKAWDDVADVTIKSGLRLVQRIFGRRPEGEALPVVVAEVVDNPGDDDMAAQLRVAIRRALKEDPELAKDVAAIVAEAAPGAIVTQHVVAGRDAYTAGRDMTINRRPD
jgi:hypothetical protein